MAELTKKYVLEMSEDEYYGLALTLCHVKDGGAESAFTGALVAVLDAWEGCDADNGHYPAVSGSVTLT